MPNITFSSPMHKDKTVYAVAGSHTKTVLTLARENIFPSTSAAKTANVRLVW